MMKEFFKNFMAALAAIASVATLLSLFFAKDMSDSGWTWAIICLSFIVLICIIYASIMIKKKKHIKLNFNPDLDIIVEQGDLFKKQGIIVIPVNEYFDTIVDEIIISSTSIHGMFINNLWRDRLTDLQNRIDTELAKQQDKKISDDERTGGNPSKYPIGTCIDIKDGGNTYVLFALTHFDKNQKAYTDSEEYDDVIKNLINHIENIAGARTVYMPVPGTGLSRLKKEPQRTLLHMLERINFIKDFSIVGDLHIVIYSLKHYNLNEIEHFFKGAASN